jgi:hypothetical protein
MAINYALPLRIVQGVFAVVVLGLTAYGNFSLSPHSLFPSI